MNIMDITRANMYLDSTDIIDMTNSLSPKRKYVPQVTVVSGL